MLALQPSGGLLFVSCAQVQICPAMPGGGDWNSRRGQARQHLIRDVGHHRQGLTRKPNRKFPRSFHTYKGADACGPKKSPVTPYTIRHPQPWGKVH